MAKTIVVGGKPYKLSMSHYQMGQIIDEIRRNPPLRDHVQELAARGRPCKAVSVARVLEPTEATEEEERSGRPRYRVLGEGWAICSQKDQFVKAAGRAIATERALFRAFGPKRKRGRIE